MNRDFFFTLVSNTDFMRLKIHFFLLNENFSPEYAEANFGGEDSENNLRYEWEDELEVSENLESITILENGVLPMQGYLPDETFFDEKVTGMRLIELKLNAEQIAYMGVSESILDSIESEINDDVQTIKMYIKDYEPLSNPMPGVFVASKEFPKALIF